MKKRIDALRLSMTAAGCDAFISLSPPANQYFTRFTGSTSALVVTEDRALFLCDFRYTEQAGTEVHHCEIEEVQGSLEQETASRLNALGVKRAVFDPAVLTVASRDKIGESFTGELKPVPEIVTHLQRVKQPVEIERIRAALKLGEGVLADGLSILAEGISEREVAAWFESEFKKRGASGAAFDTIALFGERTSLVHGQPSGRTLKRGDIVLIDFGCRLDGYCGDLTRTYAFGTIPDSWFEEIYGLTATAQQIALETLRPGKRGREVDAVARNLIAEGGYGEHFGHGLGHGLGISVHEEPRLAKTSETVLEPGMVVTVEPGIYLPKRGGVRIEDVAVVTKDGCELLSSAPRELRILQQ